MRASTLHSNEVMNMAKKNELITAAAQSTAKTLSAFTALEVHAKRVQDAVKEEEVTANFAELHFTGGRIQGAIKAGNVVIKIDQ